jgi:2-iminobutanoate/2-iminopropanoate deaminase
MRPLLLLVLPAALVLGSCARGAGPGTATPRPEVEFLTPYGPPSRPFSPAVRVGNLLFLSGQIGTQADASGTLVTGGIEAETRQTMENIKEVLSRTGSSLENVVKCTVMMADMAEWPRMNQVYTTYFPRNKPARSALGANGLALGARVEIECIAVVPSEG